MMDRRIFRLVRRARHDLDEVMHELLEQESGATPGIVEDDLSEVRARVQALEARVAVIEERGDI